MPTTKTMPSPPVAREGRSIISRLSIELSRKPSYQRTEIKEEFGFYFDDSKNPGKRNSAID